jgi:hypothetical protein
MEYCFHQLAFEEAKLKRFRKSGKGYSATGSDIDRNARQRGDPLQKHDTNVAGRDRLTRSACVIAQDSQSVHDSVMSEDEIGEIKESTTPMSGRTK